MKKLITTLFAIAVIAAAIVAVYRFWIRKSIPDAQVEEQVMAILDQNDCFVCHSSNPKLPFYSSFPIIGKMMEQHVDHAVKFTDLEARTENIADIDEVTLSMIEHALQYNTMPIIEYKMIHWGTGFTAREADILCSWIKDTRARRFSTGLSAEEFAAEPVCPVPASVDVDPKKVALGEKMYNDPRISLDGTISCASCHVLKIGGVDDSPTRTSEGIYGQFGGVNAPTVYNAYYNVQQFWNGRAATLQEQAAGPPVNPVEMGDQTWDQIVARLATDKALVKEFKALYPTEGLTASTVTDAIAEFEKTLLTPDCRFDLYLKGNKDILTEEEKAGYEAFKENSCAACHTGVILGGKSFERLSVFGDYFADRSEEIAYNGDDDGLKGFTGKDTDLQKFKVPGLRNVALTAPYFHDGTMESMEDAVRAMAKYELGKELEDKDVKSIVAFMGTLTGKHPYLSAE